MFVRADLSVESTDNSVHEFKDWPKCTYRYLVQPQAERHYGSRVGYLSHHAVCTCVLLILEDDVGVVVGGELLEALRVPGYFPFVSPAGPERLLRHVGAELLVGERREFSR